jgi:hypothetical protein
VDTRADRPLVGNAGPDHGSPREGSGASQQQQQETDGEAGLTGQGAHFPVQIDSLEARAHHATRVGLLHG